MKTILLKLSGPLQSWGTSSKFETRETDYYPSKSAIIGMVGACMGLKRDEDEKIRKLNELKFLVRVDQAPGLCKDYQTVEKTKKNGAFDRNYVTNRYYIEDGVFLVALSHEDIELIDEIIKSLENPYFQPYMGRRSCPLPGDFLLGARDLDPLETVKETKWLAQDWFKKKNKNYKAYLYGDREVLEGDLRLRNDRVVSFSQKERSFSPRYEARSYQDFSLEFETDHDPFTQL